MIPSTALEASQEFVHELRRELAEVKFDRLTRLLYSTDASIYQMMPVGVAFPREAAEIAAAVAIAGRYGVPILPRGGGSSLAGQAVGHALVLDLSRHLDRILQVNPQERWVRIQPGITLGVLNQQLRPHGLMFGPDPASAERATMGGVVGNNSTGAHSILYGMTSDHVLELETVLADGSQTRFAAFPADEWPARAQRPGLEGDIYRGVRQVLTDYAKPIAARYPRTFRTVAGYGLDRLAGAKAPNLARLLTGSEGTLAVTTEMVLNLVPVPRMTRLAMVHFSDMRRSLEAVPALLETRPYAIELLDRMLLELTRERLEYRPLLTFVQGEPEIVMAVEYAGESAGELQAGVERLQATLKQLGHREPVVVLEDPAEQARVWHVRKVGLGILMSVRGDSKPIPFIEDAAVPVEHLADYISTIHAFCNEVGVDRVAMYAHASAGCIHVRPLVNLKRAEGVRQLRAIAERSVELAVRYGGTTSGEHGEGLARGEFSERLFGQELVQAFRQVKTAFDPHGLMNPGKVVDVARMDDERLLRYGSDYALPQQPAAVKLSFEADLGFARAVEMCNGAGVCRKHGDGVMCPSFMVTHDEAHSTRGRANALRAAMMGLLGPEGMTSSELYSVLDLCLSCQACKRECPSAVDMAKLKAEFLHGYHRRHGTPLRSRLFAHIGGLHRAGQTWPSLTNRLLRGPGRWALSALGLHPQRRLPALAPQTFSRWFFSRRGPLAGRPDGPGPPADREVVFFHDTFTEHNEPQIGQAAIRLLEACGYQPIVLRRRACCGRPAYSKGVLDLAQLLAMRNIELLEPYARRGIPIVGVEPSCISMLTGEYLDLVPGAAAQAVAEAASLLEDFLLREEQAGVQLPAFTPHPQPILYHGHCQQKANFGIEGPLDLLARLPGAQLLPIDSGCCGMAGSFGYEREHFELSIQLAELSLAPAVRAAPVEAVVCASGTSCREQIRHTTGRTARHPVELLAAALPEEKAARPLRPAASIGEPSPGVTP